MQALVTGASGFIGSKLVERLVDRGDDVTCLVRTTSDTSRLEPLGVRLVEGDVRDIDSIDHALDEAEIVYHLAGLAMAFDPRELVRVNVVGFQNVVTACAARETPPVLVSVSSLAAAGPSRPERPRVESDPPRPVSNYGRTKRAAEITAASFAARVPITIVRPPIVFGEGDLQMRDVFRSIFRYGIHLALGVSRSRYSLIHVNDLVDALILCGQRGARLEAASDAPASSQGYYFVAGDEQPTFTELGRMIANCLGRQSVRVLPTSGPTLLWLAASLAEIAARLRGSPYIFNFDKAREASAGNWTCSSAAIRGQLGFAPRATMVERLRQTSEWYRQQNLL